MKDFEPLRYLRKYWTYALLVFALGVCAAYYLLSSSMSYVASSALTFTFSEASSGYCPDGAYLDCDEIASVTVISNALADLNVPYSADEISSAILIQEYVPEEVRSVQIGAWDDGLEYEYHPTTFYISLELPDRSCGRILEAVLDSYIEYFGENHLGVYQLPNHTESLEDIGYDYIEYAEVLQNYAGINRDYLYNAKDIWGSFRSSKTGYTFRDLGEEYTLLLDRDIDALISTIICGNVTEERDLLLTHYTRRIEDNELSIASEEEYIEYLQEIIDTFTETNRKNTEFFRSSDLLEGLIVDTENAAGILNLIQDSDRTIKDDIITYDDLLCEYVDAMDRIEHLKTDNIYCSNILKAFDTTRLPDSDAVSATKELTETIVNELNKLDAVLLDTVRENAEKLSAKSVRQDYNVTVSPSFSMKLYLAAAVACLFLVCFAGVIIIGRLLDFFDFGKKENAETDLPDDKQALEIQKKYRTKVLPFGFTYLAVKLLDHADADEETQHASRLAVYHALQTAVDKDDAICFNGKDLFSCYLENSSKTRAEAVKKNFESSLCGETAVDYKLEYDVCSVRYPNLDSLIHEVNRRLNETDESAESARESV